MVYQYRCMLKNIIESRTENCNIYMPINIKYTKSLSVYRLLYLSLKAVEPSNHRTTLACSGILSTGTKRGIFYKVIVVVVVVVVVGVCCCVVCVVVVVSWLLFASLALGQLATATGAATSLADKRRETPEKSVTSWLWP